MACQGTCARALERAPDSLPSAGMELSGVADGPTQSGENPPVSSWQGGLAAAKCKRFPAVTPPCAWNF